MKSGSDFTQVLTRNEVVLLRGTWAVCYIIGYCLLLLSNGGKYFGQFYSSNGSQYPQKQLANCSAMTESNSSNDGDVNLLEESGVRTRGARSRKCPGCHLPHHNHGFGQPHIDCTGPISNQPESEIDKPCLVSGLSSLDAQIGGVSKQLFDLTDSMKEAELDLMADEEKMLLDKLKIVELEEKALQHRHRINELRRRQSP